MGSRVATAHTVSVSTVDGRSSSRSLHLQIDGENRSCSLAAEQVCEESTLTFGPFQAHLPMCAQTASSGFLDRASFSTSLGVRVPATAPQRRVDRMFAACRR